MNINKNILKDLRNEYGESFYLLDSYQFRKNYNELKDIFSKYYSNFNIAYSYKTNYTPKLCEIVNELGGYAEVVSEMELELALKVGVSYKKIIWNGPVKNNKILEGFLLNGGTCNVDSIEEFNFIKPLVIEHSNNVFNIGIRCNYDVNDGVISRFGFDVNSNEFNEILNFCLNTKNVKLINLQCHFAKRQIKYWPARVDGMIKLIDKIGYIPPRIDLGGGLFGKMEDSLKQQFNDPIPSYEDYALIVAKKFKDRFKDDMPELIIEPGSALVGDCMNFCCTVKTIKKVKDKYYASVLGSQKNISMSGVNPPLEIFNMSNNSKKYNNLDIVGFTCIEGDVIYRNYKGNIARNDIVLIKNCGSYSIVMKPPFILPNFPVLDISDGKVEIIKRKETFDDIFHTFNF